jgi:hypothetical protein
MCVMLVGCRLQISPKELLTKKKSLKLMRPKALQRDVSQLALRLV